MVVPSSLLVGAVTQKHELKSIYELEPSVNNSKDGEITVLKTESNGLGESNSNQTSNANTSKISTSKQSENIKPQETDEDLLNSVKKLIDDLKSNSFEKIYIKVPEVNESIKLSDILKNPQKDIFFKVSDNKTQYGKS